MAAFVLGNGLSRAGIDVNELAKAGGVYGCNALYRTHSATALVATDRPIAEEIQNSGYAKSNKFYTRRPLPGSGAQPVPKAYFGYSYGPIAIALAAIDGQQPIYLLGFDLGPGLDGRFNNLYADTQHYKRLGSQPTFTGNWIKQATRVMRDFPNQRFIRVYGDTTHEIGEFGRLHNYERMALKQFQDTLNKPKES